MAGHLQIRRHRGSDRHGSKEEALRPKPKGRPKGAKAAPGPMTREQELERRVQKLEAENAYLKKSIALKAEKRSRTARRRRS